MQNQWFDNFILTAQNADVDQGMINMLSSNKSEIIKVGSIAFKEYLLRIDQGEMFDALTNIYDQLDNNDLKNIVGRKADDLSKVAADLQVSRGFWSMLSEQLSTKPVLCALGSKIEEETK